jgi:hypothetical protein
MTAGQDASCAPGLWTRPGPATLVVRRTGWVVCAPGTPKAVLERAWTMLARPVDAEGLVSGVTSGDSVTSHVTAASASGPGPGSDPGSLPEIAFCLVDGSHVQVGTTGDLPLAVHTATGHRLIGGSERMTMDEADQVLRVSFGRLPEGAVPGTLRMVEGMTRVRGLIHQLCDPGTLQEDQRAALAAQIRTVGTHVGAPTPVDPTPRPTPRSSSGAPARTRPAPPAAEAPGRRPIRTTRPRTGTPAADRTPRTQGNRSSTRITGATSESHSPGIFENLLATPPPQVPRADDRTSPAQGVHVDAPTSANRSGDEECLPPTRPTGTRAAGESDLVDTLFGRTQVRSIEGAAVRPADDTDPGTTDLNSIPDAPGFDAPGPDHPAADDPAPDHPGPDDPSPGHPAADDPAPYGTVRAATGPEGPALSAHPPRPVLHLTAGRRRVLDRALVVGRRPHPSGAPDPTAAGTLVVDSPCRDVSRSHLLLRPAGDTVLVTDLGSANGTVLRPEGGRPHRLPPHTDTEVPDGSVLDLGEDVRIRVIVHDPAGPGTSLPEEG